MSYAVVLFTEEDCVETVPVSWIEEDKCFWPQKNAKKKISNGEQPDKDLWRKFQIRRIGRVYNTLEEARRVCLRAEDTSNVESDSGQSRKRKQPNRYIEESESSDCADDEREEERRHCPPIGKVPIPPRGYASPRPKQKDLPRTRKEVLPSPRTFSQESALTSPGFPSSGPVTPTRTSQPHPSGMTTPPRSSQSATLPIIRRSPRGADKQPSIRNQTDSISARESAPVCNDDGNNQGNISNSNVLNQILEKLDSIHRDIKLLKETQTECLDPMEIDSLLPNGEKLNTPEELDSFEESFDELKKKKLVAWLASLENGNDGGAICRGIMRSLMTNHLMSHYSGKGQKGKMAFIGKPIYSLILIAARKSCRKQLSFEALKDEIIDVLRNAPNKPGGFNHAKKKTRKEKEVETIQTDSED